VTRLAVEIGPRNVFKPVAYRRAAQFIETAFSEAGLQTNRQTFTAQRETCANIIGEIPGTTRPAEIIVVGAHYDTCFETPGANDNGSGVAAMLALARRFAPRQVDRTLRFVAFANEEPPFYGSGNMGSLVYASSLKDKKTTVDFMISLEMIGCFSKEKIQQYPLPGMRFFYPETADFIGVAGNFSSWRYVSALKRGIRKHSKVKVQTMVGPEFVGGINLSDNASFWRHGYRAVMVTDSSFFRNRHYHQETDTMETLDFDSMAEVVKGLYHTLQEMR
jgi:Zn-dependent M28 family amino/carboxypeptidase